MMHLTGQERAQYVRAMFDRIAPRYDLMNRLIAAGQDMRWRRWLLQTATLPSRGRLLDLGTGTGDVPLAALRAHPGLTTVGADFSEGMLRAGLARSGGSGVRWLTADAMHLPFSTSTFDAVTSAFLMRNVVDLERAFGEQQRVLRPGGTFACLDTTPMGYSLLRPVLQFYFQRVVPLLGRLIAGQREAYTYLPVSTESFLTAEDLAEIIRAAGFRDVAFRRMMFGTVALHWAGK
jgi:demethylmenaquinone methyltransferase/2-methoxy-6-polyprenyl-1,4-benzoquinol methylase